MYFTSDDNIGNLYGTIWQGDAAYIVSDLKAFLKGKTEATIHLHTPGGSVFDGNLIYNALKQADAKIHIVIDGLAASMGSILMMAGDTVTMAENAFVMIHAPSGYVDGTASEMKRAVGLLESMEKQFVKQYSERTGKSESEVKSWLQGDTWFDATQAKENGLIDGIIGEVIEDIDVAAMQKLSMVALTQGFESQFMQRKEITKTDNAMKLNAKSITVLGVAETATDEQVNAAVEKLAGENDQLKAQAKAAQEARVRALIDTAVQDGRITAKDKQEWENLANANYALAESTIGKLAQKEVLPVGNTKPVTTEVDERKSWTFTDWSRKDTAGLLKMKQENPDKYKALLDAVNLG